MMDALREATGVSRRAVLRVLGLVGLTAGATPFLTGAPGVAQGQGDLGALQPEEKVDATMKRLFGSRPIKDGSKVIKIDLPLIAENGSAVPITVEVQSPMTSSNYVKHIYVISDRNRRPMNAKFTLSPEIGAATIGTNLRLNETGDVRAVVEMSDGTLLMAKREVRVTVGGCGG